MQMNKADKRELEIERSQAGRQSLPVQINDLEQNGTIDRFRGFLASERLNQHTGVEKGLGHAATITALLAVLRLRARFLSGSEVCHQIRKTCR